MVCLVGLVLAVTTACGGERDTPSTSSSATPVTQIKIVGSDSFVAQVEAALFLIADRSPDTFEWVEASVARVLSVHFWSRSGEDILQGIVRVARDSAFPPGYGPSDQVVWLAGELVLEACFINLYRAATDYYSDTASVICLKEQIAILKRLDRSHSFADHVVQYLHDNFNQELIDSVPDPDY